MNYGKRTESLSEKKGYRDIRKTLPDRRTRRHGSGTLLFSADRYDHQHDRDPVPHRFPDAVGRRDRRAVLHRRRPGRSNERSGHGSGYRIRPALSASGPVLAGDSRICLQRTGRRRRSAGSPVCSDPVSRDRQSCEQRDKSRYPGHTPGDDRRRHSPVRLVGTRARQGRNEGRRPYHVGDRTSALLDGHLRISRGRDRADAPHLLRSHLRRTWPDRTCRRRCRSRLLRPDGRFRSHVL